MCPHATLDWRKTQPDAVVSAAVVRIVVGGTQYGATKRVRGVPMLGGWRVQVNPPAGTFDRGSLGHETCHWCAETGATLACELHQWDLRWSSLWATKRVRGVPKRA
eukprot:9207708-Pyramimonas_sp.AAC.1